MFSKLLDKSVLTNTLQMVEDRLYEQLVDFDNHLEDPRLDWVNPEINDIASSSSHI